MSLTMNPMPGNDIGASLFPEPSQVRLVFARNVDELLSHLKCETEEQGDKYRLVSITIDRLPALRSLIEGILDRLADVALSLYPGWFGGDISFAQIESSYFS